MDCKESGKNCSMIFYEEAYVCKKCLGLDKIIPLIKSNKSQIINADDLVKKLYADIKINNICHELIMNIDKLIQLGGWEFKTAADRDFVADETLKFMLSCMGNFVQVKGEKHGI